jgi:hypothetical protein
VCCTGRLTPGRSPNDERDFENGFGERDLEKGFGERDASASRYVIPD